LAINGLNLIKIREKKYYLLLLLQGPRTAKPFEQWLSLLASTESLGKLAKQV